MFGGKEPINDDYTEINEEMQLIEDEFNEYLEKKEFPENNLLFLTWLYDRMSVYSYLTGTFVNNYGHITLKELVANFEKRKKEV